MPQQDPFNKHTKKSVWPYFDAETVLVWNAELKCILEWKYSHASHLLHAYVYREKDTMTWFINVYFKDAKIKYLNAENQAFQKRKLICKIKTNVSPPFATQHHCLLYMAEWTNQVCRMTTWCIRNHSSSSSTGHQTVSSQ